MVYALRSTGAAQQPPPMDQAGAPQGPAPSRSSSSSPSRTPPVLKQPRPESSQRLSVTPFHRSAVIGSDAAQYRKRMAGKPLASLGGPFLGAPGSVAAPLRGSPPSSSTSPCASTDPQREGSEKPNAGSGSAQKPGTPLQVREKEFFLLKGRKYETAHEINEVSLQLIFVLSSSFFSAAVTS